ncbi:FAD-dependent monooxygenase [Streptomyces violascens]|uniref:FAD-dependent monooxygenase n=1 Tax=Streptomyces violascens TaxID=67381 RepID=UPI00368CD60D
MSESCDVLVIGAGPTGLALSIALRQYGVDTVVVDKEPSTKREARACVIWQRALEVLRDLGCADRLHAEGLSLRRAEIHARGRALGGHDMSMTDTAYPQPLSIEQDATERLLGDRLGELGTEVRWSTEAVDVRVTGDAAETELRGPDGKVRTVHSRWVVGCEGSRSLVRTSLDIPFEGERRPNLQAVQINAKADWRPRYAPDVTYFFLEHQVCVIASPVPGGGYRFFCFCTDPDPRIDEPPSVSEMQNLVARAAHDPGARLVPTSPAWSNRARFQDRLAGTLRTGPALLAGDSAHLWAPIGGHGLNTGLRGAHNLGWKLAAVHRGWAVDSLLDTYSTEQRHTAKEVMREMRRNVLELPPTRLTLHAMGLVGPSVLASERAGRRVRSTLSDFVMHYRASELSGLPGSAVGGGGTPRAGDRLPDLPVVVAGRRRSLHDLLSYEKWTLLLLPGAWADDAGVRRLADTYAAPIDVVRVHAESGRHSGLPRGELLLVRPDGYIGLRARAGDRARVAAYLDRWLIRAA